MVDNGRDEGEAIAGNLGIHWLVQRVQLASLGIDRVTRTTRASHLPSMDRVLTSTPSLSPSSSSISQQSF